MTTTPESTTLTIDQAIQQAVEHHRAGRLLDAERLYQAILQVQPGHPDANHNMGVLAVTVKKPAMGLPFFKAAIEANPNVEQFWLSYISTLIQTEQIEDARHALIQMRKLELREISTSRLSLRPPTALCPSSQDIDGLSSAFSEGRYREAEALAKSMTEHYPDHGFAWKVLGAALKQLGFYTEALGPMKQAVLLSPLDAAAHSNLSATLRDMGLLEKAEANCRYALEINPSFADAHYNLGTILRDIGRYADAEDSLLRALELKPNYADAHTCLGLVLLAQGRAREGLIHFRAALATSPSLLAALEGQSMALKRIVPEWHVPMMNEEKRNTAYYRALKSAISSDSNIFEIGTGSGLLSLMAAQIGAKKVTTCEAEPLIADTARQIVADNSYEHIITVIPKRSDAIELGEHLSENADILVSEIFSSELLAEQVLPSIEDAKRRLLQPNARVIPAAGSIMVALFGGGDIGRNLVIENSFGFNLQRFNSIISKKCLIARSDLKIELLTDDTEAFRFDFERDSFFPCDRRVLRVPISATGRCYGVIQWIRLQMDTETVFENHPSERSAVSNWQHCAYVLPEPIDVRLGQTAIISASHNRIVPWFSFDGIESS